MPDRPVCKLPSCPGSHQSYQLEILVKRPIHLRVGALGVCRFPAGVYLYTGSARRNLAARLRRHLARAKKLRWHIDYLLDHPAVRVRAVRTSSQEECSWCQQSGGTVICTGFGSSDCRSRCGAHLRRISDLPAE